MITNKLVLGLLLLCALPLAALDSFFMPELRSEMHSSLLQENPFLHEVSFMEASDGITHPFRSKNAFISAIREAFSTGDPQRCMLSYRHQQSDFKADFGFMAGYETSFIDDESYGFWYKGWNLDAQAGKHWNFRTSWYNGAYNGDLDLAETDVLIDGYYKRFSDHIQLDNISTQVSYNTQNLALSLGRGRFALGNSISGSIVLSDKVNDYAYLQAEGSVGAFTLSFMHASLVADSSYATTGNEYVDSRNLPDKYIAVHQLAYQPTSWMQVFAGETVVYGNRSIDVNYLLPNSFWRAVEHNTWDRDNVLLFGGLNLYPAGNILVYLNTAVDEFSYGKILTNWWGNKYAVQTGVSYRPDLMFLQRRYTLELTAIRPFTYTHFMNHTMYSHDGNSLGYSKGSNLINLCFEANHKIQKLIDLDTQVSFTKQGSVGNDWRENYHDTFAGQIDTATASWLEGDIITIYSIQNSLKLPIFAHHKLLVGHSSEHNENWLHHLYAAWQFIF